MLQGGNGGQLGEALVPMQLPLSARPALTTGQFFLLVKLISFYLLRAAGLDRGEEVGRHWRPMIKIGH